MLSLKTQNGGLLLRLNSTLVVHLIDKIVLMFESFQLSELI